MRGRLFLTLMTAAILTAEVSGFELSEHRLLGDSAYAHVSRVVDNDLPIGFADSSFGEWCAARAQDDMLPARFHEHVPQAPCPAPHFQARGIRPACPAPCPAHPRHKPVEEISP